VAKNKNDLIDCLIRQKDAKKIREAVGNTLRK
jgi:hypothetical protein